MTPTFSDTGITLYCAEALETLKTLPDASVDSVVSDPPSGISFMGAKWDGHKGGRDEWIAWLASIMSECLRIAKPGSYALVWALPRTSHWTGTAIEDAGWVIQDRISHLFGQGFPKHKSKLKPACEDWWLAWKPDRYATPLPGLDGCRIGVNGGRDRTGRGVFRDSEETNRRAGRSPVRYPFLTIFSSILTACSMSNKCWTDR